MTGLVSYGLLAGIVGGLALVILAIVMAFSMHSIFKTWSAPRLATFSSAFGPVLLGIPILALTLYVANGLASGPEAQGLIVMCVATAVALTIGFLLGRRIVLILLEKTQTK